ncbi:ubiquitin-specific protease ubp2 [Tieghemiomyces parasiticus]|uniref:ubiquitinyl hydrolase 1 n=1 Tax=Tieghemiomyces parasiticus TaxID=78921 RepID=A0A9W8ADS2_9FUNG|nr:ubiquitin-specific protease ubp2 [Tieghemiomyces parasiticus]
MASDSPPVASEVARSCGTAAYFVENFLSTWNLGLVPHRHAFRALPKPLADNRGLELPVGINQPTQAICSICDQLLHVRCDELSMVDFKVPCSQAITHHFHWTAEGEDSKSNTGFHEATVKCCQCLFTATLTMTAPTIPAPTMSLLERSRVVRDIPARLLSETDRHQIFGRCLETLLIYITNLLDGQRRTINTENPSFQERIGYDAASVACFEALGFRVEDRVLQPPELDPVATARLWRARYQLEVRVAVLYHRTHPGTDHPKYRFSTADAALGKALGTRYPPRQRTSAVIPADYLAEQHKDITPSYSALGCVPSMSDAVLVWAYRVLAQEDPAGGPVYLDALYDLGLGRRSDTIQAAVDGERIAGHFPATEIRNAYSYFEADAATVTDYQLAMLYTVLVNDRPDKAAYALNQLQKLATARHSAALEQFLQRGGDTAAFPEDLSADTTVDAAPLPAGLDNIGNTCYLNSLLQYYYSVLPLRQAVLDPTVWNTELVVGHRDGTRTVTRDEIAYAVTYAERLRGLFAALQDTRQPSIRPDRELARQSLTNAREEAAATATATPAESGAPVQPGPVPAAVTITKEADAPASPASLNVPPIDVDKPLLVDEPVPSAVEAAASLPSPPPEPAMDVDEPEVMSAGRHLISVPNSPAYADGPQKKVRFDQEREPSPVRLTVEPEPTPSVSSVAAEKAVVEQGNEATVPGPRGLPPPLPARPRTPLADGDGLPKSSPPTPATSSGGNQMMFGRQQDVSECMENIMSTLETGLLPNQGVPPLLAELDELDGPSEDSCGASTPESAGDRLARHEDPRRPGANLIRQLFFGVTRQALHYQDTATEKPVRTVKHEVFSHLLVQAEAGLDLYDGLDAYFGESTVSYANTEATREVYAEHLPAFLQIQIQRVQFDVAQSRVYKNNAFVKFDPVIYLDRYLLGLQSSLSTQRERAAALQHNIRGAQETIQRLMEQPGSTLTVPAMLDATIAYLRKEKAYQEEQQKSPDADADAAQPMLIDVADEAAASSLATKPAASDDRTATTATAAPTPAEYDAHIRNLLAVRESLDAQRQAHEADIARWTAETKTVYADLRDVPYRAHAVFMHRGEASYGHYWVYLRDHAQSRWLKFNDAVVTRVDEAEVFNDTTGSNANPYLIVYVRDTELAGLTPSA